MINLNPSYRGALTAITIVVALAWMTTPAEAHETVVVDVANGNGVLTQLCQQIVRQALTIGDIDVEDAPHMFQACFDYSAEQMYVGPYVHGHS